MSLLVFLILGMRFGIVPAPIFAKNVYLELNIARSVSKRTITKANSFVEATGLIGDAFLRSCGFAHCLT